MVKFVMRKTVSFSFYIHKVDYQSISVRKAIFFTILEHILSVVHKIRALDIKLNYLATL